MGKNIHTIDSHVTYRKGELTTGTPSKGKVACGPGTAYPVPATLDQIAEIFYRVRNTIISGGEYIPVCSTRARHRPTTSNKSSMGETAGRKGFVVGIRSLQPQQTKGGLSTIAVLFIQMNILWFLVITMTRRTSFACGRIQELLIS